MVSVVNGYTCFTSCDVEAAKQGRDPSKPVGTPPDGPGKKSGFDKQPATVFGGTLQQLLSSDPSSGSSTPSTAAKPTVDLLV